MSGVPRPEQVRTIDRDQLAEMMRHGESFRLVMALNQWAFDAKHIPGSEHFNTPEELFASLREDEEIIVYCTSEDCHSSLALYEARYSGGLTDWEDAGLPLEGNWAT